MALLALLAGGCGGGDDEDAPTKAEFIEQADAICQESNQERILASEQLFKEQDGLPSDPEEKAFIAETWAPIVRGQHESLSELTPPAGEEEEAEALWAAFEKALNTIESEPVGAIAKGLKIFMPFEQMAIKYGFDECAAI